MFKELSRTLDRKILKKTQGGFFRSLFSSVHWHRYNCIRRQGEFRVRSEHRAEAGGRPEVRVVVLVGRGLCRSHLTNLNDVRL